MKKNMNNIDRIARLLFAVGVGILFGMEIITGTLAVVAMAVAGVLVATSFVRFCPIYAALGLRSCKPDASGECP